MITVQSKSAPGVIDKTWDIPEDEFDKILSMAISALARCDDRSPMENKALSFALKMEAR